MALTKIPRPAPAGPSAETAELLADLQAMQIAFHKLHLKITGPGSDAAHRALGSFYTSIPDMIDSLAEQYQGATEKLLDIPSANYNCGSVQEALAHLREVYGHINDLQKVMPFSEIVNELDEIKSLINSTKYKLLFLQ